MEKKWFQKPKYILDLDIETQTYDLNVTIVRWRHQNCDSYRRSCLPKSFPLDFSLYGFQHERIMSFSFFYEDG